MNEVYPRTDGRYKEILMSRCPLMKHLEYHDVSGTYRSVEKFHKAAARRSWGNEKKIRPASLVKFTIKRGSHFVKD